MNIWSFRSRAVGILLGSGLALVACDELSESFAPSQSADKTETTEPKAETGVTLKSTNMMRGAFALVPPTGYCVEPSTLSSDFALLGKCEAFGSTSPIGTPTGIVTVSVTRVGSRADLKDLLPATLPSDAQVFTRQATDQLVMARIKAAAPKQGMSDTYWRGLAHIGPYLVGLAAYGAKGSSVTGKSGGTLLNSLVSRTAAATKAKAANRPANPFSALFGPSAKTD